MIRRTPIVNCSCCSAAGLWQPSDAGWLRRPPAGPGGGSLGSDRAGHNQDLANLDFDARIGNVDVLSYLSIEKRFLPATEVRREHIPL